MAARSAARSQKERAMRMRVVHGLMRQLVRLRKSLRRGRLKDRDKLLLRIGQLKARGFEVAAVDMSEISKTGGGIHCMAQALKREPA